MEFSFFFDRFACVRCLDLSKAHFSISQWHVLSIWLEMSKTFQTFFPIHGRSVGRSVCQTHSNEIEPAHIDMTGWHSLDSEKQWDSNVWATIAQIIYGAGMIILISIKIKIADNRRAFWVFNFVRQLEREKIVWLSPWLGLFYRNVIVFCDGVEVYSKGSTKKG